MLPNYIAFVVQRKYLDTLAGGAPRHSVRAFEPDSIVEQKLLKCTYFPRRGAFVFVASGNRLPLLLSPICAYPLRAHPARI